MWRSAALVAGGTVLGGAAYENAGANIIRRRRFGCTRRKRRGSVGRNEAGAAYAKEDERNDDNDKAVRGGVGREGRKGRNEAVCVADASDMAFEGGMDDDGESERKEVEEQAEDADADKVQTKASPEAEEGNPPETTTDTSNNSTRSFVSLRERVKESIKTKGNMMYWKDVAPEVEEEEVYVRTNKHTHTYRERERERERERKRERAHT